MLDEQLILEGDRTVWCGENCWSAPAPCMAQEYRFTLIPITLRHRVGRHLAGMQGMGEDRNEPSI